MKTHTEWKRISSFHAADKVCFRTHSTYKMGKRLEMTLHKKKGR